MTLTATNIVKPNDSDCLFGRGRRFQNHPGNRTLHRLVNEHLAEFVVGNCDTKNMLIAKVVDIVKQGSNSGNGDASPGRFLRRRAISDQGQIKTVWDEVSNADARAKVGHTFRSRTRPQNESEGSRRSSNQVTPFPSAVSQPKIAPKAASRQVTALPSARQALVASFVQKQQQQQAAQRQHLQAISDAELLRLADQLLIKHGRTLPSSFPSVPLTHMTYRISQHLGSTVFPPMSAGLLPARGGLSTVELLEILSSVTQSW